ncbi:MAG TPA: PAS domain S-box protein [Gaiellaceae bacterium]|nr:PAS domain S-box protein [Gaiellaceae bacterium]
MRTRSLVLLAAVGLALGGIGTGLVLASEHLDNKAAFLALALTVGLSFLASGVIALWRRPRNRTGFLLVLVAYLWFLGALTESENDWIFTLGVLVNSFTIGAFVHLLLAYPTGRLRGRRDLWLVISTYVLVFVGSTAQLLVDEQPDSNCPSCESTIAVTSSDTAHSIASGVVSVFALALVVAVLAIVVTRFLRAKGALRRALGPVLGTGALVLGILLVQLVVDTFSEDAAEQLFYVFLVTFALVPVAFLAGVLRSRLARVGVADLLVELGRGIPLRDALAHALRDPSLDLVYWLPGREQLVLPDGTEFQGDDGLRLRHDVKRNGQLVGALIHDPSLADEPELVDAVAAAAALWLENERLQAEVRAQFVFLETIVNTAPSLLMSLDPDGRIANFNTACERASGFENVEEVRREYFWDVFISPEERDDVRERFRTNPAHPAATWENTFVNRRGEEMVIAWSTAPLLDESGNVRNIICGGLDVTERKRHEIELDRERDFLRKVADITPSLLVVVDDAANVVEDAVNDSFVQVMGWSDAEMQGRSFADLFHDEDRYFAKIGVASAFNGVDPQLRLSRWVTRDGGERVIEWTATPIVDILGRERVLVCGVDVTERERREHDLRSSEERLRATIEASPVAVLEVDLDDRIALWNPAAERMFGWSAEEMIGGPLRHIPDEERERLAELMTRVRSGEVYTGVEAKRLCKDGSLIDVEISAAPIRDASDAVISHLALFADITDRKLQEEELRASRARIVKAGDEARRRLERNLHDGAQQRLVALSLSLRLAQAKVGSDPPAANAVLESAREELTAALDELRELARGIHPAVLTDRGLAAALEALATRLPIPVEIETPDVELPQAVEAAAYYVIAEALANVIKYARASVVTVRITCDESSTRVEVVDDGVGGADAAGGSGLRGLSDRVAALEGTLTVDSPPAGGTRIVAEIPLDPDPDLAAQAGHWQGGRPAREDP